MERTTSSEFVEWMELLQREEWEFPRRMDYFFAQIAAEVRRSFVKHPAKVKLQDFLLRFTGEKRETRRASNPAMSKVFWMSALGLLKKKGS